MEIKEKRRKPTKLRTIFVRYLGVFCIGIICWTLLLAGIFTLLIANGMLYPANYSEQAVANAKSTIAESDTVTPDMIPALCTYAVYNNDGAVLSGDMGDSDAKTAWQLLESEQSGQDFNYFYTKIPRENQVCIIRYTLKPQYKSDVLREYLPNPELLAMILFLLGFVIGTFTLASTFGKKLAKKMSSLQEATDKIKNQDLDFTTKSSGILEIDDILTSIEQMKDALKTSLKEQWDLEQTRRMQISALAHDIKTPLTVVKGNTELLTETVQSAEQKEYTAYIENGVAQIEQYLKTLIDLAKAENGGELLIAAIDTNTFLSEWKEQTVSLLTAKNLKLHFHAHHFPACFYGDAVLLQRALMNIVMNAVEYSPLNGAIDIHIDATDHEIRFRVTDQGKGFSPADLKEATKQFYSGEQSRSSKNHYGMGLFIAKSIAAQHHGSLLLTNTPVSKGAEVTFIIPYSEN